MFKNIVKMKCADIDAPRSLRVGNGALSEKAIDDFVNSCISSIGTDDIEIVLDMEESPFYVRFFAYEWEDIREETLSDIESAPTIWDLDPYWEDCFREELYY